MSDQDFQIKMLAGAKELARELDRHPFASAVFFDGRWWPREKARALERAFWPLAYPKQSAAKGIAARSDQTPQGAEPAGQEPGPGGVRP